MIRDEMSDAWGGPKEFRIVIPQMALFHQKPTL